MSRKSKKRAKQAIPEEILAEGSGPHAEADPVDPADADPVVEADAQALADAAADALGSAEIASVEAEVEAAAMAAEVVVTAAEVARADERDKMASKKKRGRKAQAPEAAEPEVRLDAWGQPIIVDEEPPSPEAPEAIQTAEAVDAGAESMEAEVSEMSGDEHISDEPVSDDSVSDEPALEAAASDETAAELEGEGDADAEGATLPTSAATLDAQELKNLVEALVFAADKPVTIQRLRQLTRVSDVRRLEAALGSLAEDYKARGIALTVVSGGYQFRTNTTYSTYVQQLIAGRPVRLSRAQLETLAIVAYRQPITRPEIDEIRGVDSSSTLKVLLDRALIRILGKREEAGRPTLYGTTKEFLDFFSLGDLRELPTLREYSELTAESRKVVSDRLGVGLEGAPADAAAPSDQAPTEDAAATEPGADVELAADAPADAMTESPASADAEVAIGDEPAIDVAPSEMDLASDSMEARDESHVDVPAAETDVEAAPALESSADLSDEAHEAEPASDLSAAIAVAEESHMASDPSADIADEPHGVAAEPELAAADLSDESHVGLTDEPVELAASADEPAELAASADADQVEAEEPVHGFIDPEEIAGRVVSGESDTAAHDEFASELEAAPAGETAEHAHDASDPDASDTSAPDDPPVD